MRKTNFTLLELLIVIAIITILASMLLSALSKAKDVSRSILCISNEKQCAIIGTAYAGDYNGHIIIYSGTNNIPWHKYFYQSGYIKNPKRPETICPFWSPYKYDSTRPETMHYSSYGMTSYWSSNSFFLCVTSAFSYRALMTNKVIYPSNYFFFSDSLGMSPTAAGGTLYRQQALELVINAPAHSRLHTRHKNNRANIVFLDGHAEACADTQIVGSVKQINGDSDYVKVFNKNTIEKQLYP